MGFYVTVIIHIVLSQNWAEAGVALGRRLALLPRDICFLTRDTVNSDVAGNVNFDIALFLEILNQLELAALFFLGSSCFLTNLGIFQYLQATEQEGKVDCKPKETK